jgi:hypothetical protein
MPRRVRVKYPYVVCDAHPHATLEPGYGICPHVLNDGAPVAHFVAATKLSIGMIGCAECTPEKTPGAEQYVLICAHGARDNGWAPAA